MTDQPPMTESFREQVLRKRPYLKIEWCLHILASPLAREIQADGRTRCWGVVDDLPGKAVQVVTLEDGVTRHNAFPNSGITSKNV
jgi:hypothetical protein